MKTWKKTTYVKNMNTGNVSFSVEDALTLRAGDKLELYKPKFPKVKKNLRGCMIVSQADIEKMTYEQDLETKEYYYLMAYTLTK